MFKLKNFNHSEVIKVSEIINELVMNFVRTVNTLIQQETTTRN